jgi:recombinational DNA repair protein (RecF pathway)
MKEYITEAIVLKVRPRGEADKSVDVFTKDFGRLCLRVTAGKRILSKFSPHLEPLNLVIARIVKKDNYTMADVLAKRQFRRRNFPLAIQARALELIYLLGSQLPIGSPDLHLWFSLLRALESGKFEFGHFLKILGHDAERAKCFICASRPVSFFSLSDQVLLCAAHAGKFPQNELIYIK